MVGFRTQHKPRIANVVRRQHSAWIRGQSGGHSYMQAIKRSTCAGAGFGSEALQQLVLIVADGRFHEKAALQRAVREVRATAATPWSRGLPVAFVRP